MGPTPPEPLDVIVLAGGRGRRLGRDKALLERGGGRQVDHIVAVVRALGGQVIVAGGERALHLVDVTSVRDARELVGPLAGVVAGLRVAATDLVALVAVDLVRPDVGLLQWLANLVRADQLPGAMPEVGDRSQPLHAVVRADRVGRLATAGPRLVEAMLAAGVSTVPEATWRAGTPDAQPALDLDTPDDLTALGSPPKRPTEPPPPPQV